MQGKDNGRRGILCLERVHHFVECFLRDGVGDALKRRHDDCVAERDAKVPTQCDRKTA